MNRNNKNATLVIKQLKEGENRVELKEIIEQRIDDIERNE